MVKNIFLSKLFNKKDIKKENMSCILNWPLVKRLNARWPVIHW